MKTYLQISKETLNIVRALKGTEEQISNFYEFNDFRNLITVEIMESDLIENYFEVLDLNAM